MYLLNWRIYLFDYLMTLPNEHMYLFNFHISLFDQSMYSLD